MSKSANQSPTALGSSASNSPGTLKAHSSNSDRICTEKPIAKGSNENTAWSSQVRHSDVANTNTSTVRPVAETTKNPIGTKLSHNNLKISRKMLAS